MGDVIHALPAVASLKASFPDSHLAWAVDPKWAVLLAGNPYVDEVIPLNRKNWQSVKEAWATLRSQRFDLAVDFQGLMKSAVVARASGAAEIVGLGRAAAREGLASLAYTRTCAPEAAHIVDRHMELARAAGATGQRIEFPLPTGSPEGELPQDFVLACPFAGWTAKEWPMANYARLANLLRLPLVLNVHPGAACEVEGAVTHVSSIAGLIDATRRARAVVGLDSGPLHLAAAMGKPGVAIFGPTDPKRNGPYGGSIRVLRAAGAVTSYKRRAEHDESMLRIRPEDVMEALENHAIPQTLR